jgi:hypothetical protein
MFGINLSVIRFSDRRILTIMLIHGHQLPGGITGSVSGGTYSSPITLNVTLRLRALMFTQSIILMVFVRLQYHFIYSESIAAITSQ